MKRILILSQIWHLFIFLNFIVISIGQQDPNTILGEGKGWTKIRDRSALSSFSVCTSSEVKGRPSLLFFYGLLSPKHILFMQEKEFPSGPV